MLDKRIQNIIIGFLYFSVVLFFFTPFVGPHLYSDDIDFAILFTFQWVLSSILWRQQFKTKTTLLLWITLSTLLIVICFIRDRVVFHFGYVTWYHPVRFYVYIGVPTTLWWILVSWAVSREKRIKEAGK